jgi:glucosamine--fructose-6-phosphate aminotransferase (isomerizing)
MTTSTIRHFPVEVLEQPEALERTDVYLREALGDDFRGLLTGIDRVIWTGSGDCYFVGVAVAAFFEGFAGVPTTAIEAYDFVTATPALTSKTLVIGFSSSGKSVYTVEAIELARGRGARTLAITNTSASRLAEVAASALVTQAGRSFSFPSKTTTTAIVVALRLAELTAELRGKHVSAHRIDDIVEATASALASAAQAAPAIAGRISAARRVVVIGSGIGRTAALIGAAKLIETSGIAASANNSEEFLHLVGFGIQEVDAVVVIDDGNLRSRLAARYAVQQGAFTVVITTDPESDELPSEAHLIQSSGGHQISRLFADVAALHGLAVAVSANRGTNPDIPYGVDLEYVIELLYTDPVDGWNAESAKGLTHAAG